jgi:hypothetical protein
MCRQLIAAVHTGGTRRDASVPQLLTGDSRRIGTRTR